MDPKNDSRIQPEWKGRVRVAVADDDPFVLEQIANLLEARFEVVALAESAQELLDAVQNLPLSVVVTDLSMPGMDGMEATRIIKELDPRIHIVVLSFNDDPSIISAAFAAGASGFVSKHKAVEELISVIENILLGSSGR